MDTTTQLEGVSKQEIVLVSGWTPPYTAEWRQNFAGLIDACKAQEKARLEAQFFFSHIILTQQFREEMVWYDHSTGETYDGEEQIPEGRKQLCSLKPRWEYQEGFVDWCDKNIPGFVKSTFLVRHRIIDKLYEVGMDFVEAVKIVAGLQIYTASERLLEVFEFNEFHEVTGFKPELAKRLPGAKDVDELPEEKQLDKVSQAAIDYLKEQSIAVEDGVSTPRKVSDNVKKNIFRRPKVKIIRPTETDSFPYAVVGLFPSQSNYELGDEKRVYLQIVSKDGEILDDFPDGIREWWEEKFFISSR